MDRLKPVWVILKKYHFWILCLLAIGLGLGVWVWQTPVLAGRFKARKGSLEGHFQNTGEIVATTNHPNQRVIEAVDKAALQLSDNVITAWEVLYKQQKSSNKLPDNLDDQVKKDFEESVAFSKEIPQTSRELYQNFIRHHFPTLFDMIQVRRVRAKNGEKSKEGPGTAPRKPAAGGFGPALPDGLGAGPRQQSEDMELVGVVEWNQADQENLLRRFQWSTAPTTFQVWLAQEDLWVYEALLRIIKNTNGGAKEQHNAPIKKIDALEIGPQAAEGSARSKSSFLPASWATDVAEAAAPSASGASAEAGAQPAAAGAAPAAEAGAAARPQADPRLLARRYVDDQGRPLEAGEPQPYSEFKMMPIRMLLLMDQRHIAKLLSECANSTMPIEVRLVRWRPGQFRAVNYGEGADSAGAPTPGYTPPPQPAAADEEGSSYDVPVELQGIIYIFNPPDREQFAKGAASGEQKPVGGATQAPAAAAPAATPPATPTGPPAAGPPAPAPAAPSGAKP